MAISFLNDKRLPTERLAVVSYLIVGMVALLLFGFWKLQIIDSDRYAQMAERNRVRSIPIIAPRGSMLDREGRVLVDNYPSFSVLLLRDSPEQVEKLLPQIADGLSMTLDDVKQEIDAAKGMPKFQPIVIKPQASPSDIAFIESHRADIPVIEMLMVHRRRYPHGDMLANAVGYVGEVSAEQVEASDSSLKPGDIVGKTGLERQYNDTLMGTDGLRRVIVNSIGKEMGRLEQKDAIPGKPIQLTIDYDLQAVADNYMADREGAVVAMDGRTGEILAMVSRPTFDPNDFAIRIPSAEWQALNADPRTPLLNRAIQGQLAPGSVFKVVMATAMMESKDLPANFTAYCPGHAEFYGRVFHCWRPEGHGVVDLHKAIVDSCDVFFYTIGQRLGIDRIDQYATGLGLGRRTGIDLPGEEPGLMPSEEWVQRVFHHKWYAGETISVAIGQGAVMVTPIQLVRMIAAVASGGELPQPHLLKNLPAKTDHFPLSEDTVEQVTQGMYGVINEGGTGSSLKLQNIEFSGKSGTAQLMSYEAGSKMGHKGKETNGWFVGYAPRRNPEIIVAAVVQGSTEHGGSTAGPVVRDLVKAYYDKKNGQKGQEYTAKGGQPKVQPASVSTPALTQEESSR
ncbi:MAG TPA: penicillin-binding protein 2 [Candidatus Acidoferrales bacterium]|nr:penicillin-binding protein 2 [Candidatus Acidoferrales bacterium]